MAASVREETTLTRKLSYLRKIREHYPKLLLIFDEDPIADYDGIRRMNDLDWLMGESQ